MLNSALFNGYLLSEAAARGPCKVMLFFGLSIIIAVSARKNNVFFRKIWQSAQSSTQARTAQIASTSMSRAKERLPVIWRPLSRTVRRMR